MGGLLLLETWTDVNAHEIDVPFQFNGWYDGGRFIGALYHLPDGRIVDTSFDLAALAPSGVDPEAWMDQVKFGAIGVHSPDYPAWIMTEVAAFGAFAVLWLAATFAIVERRRPF
jgi:hypothetical protein